MIVPGGRVFSPFKSCPGGMVMNEIDNCMTGGSKEAQAIIIRSLKRYGPPLWFIEERPADPNIEPFHAKAEGMGEPSPSHVFRK